MLDDNKAPTDAFIWAHGIRQYQDAQFNHLWGRADDVHAYTSLANICMLPAFLSELTDTHRGVRAMLHYRALELYGNSLAIPLGTTSKPAGYDDLQWAEVLPPVANLEAVYRATMRTKPGDRTVRSARELGWVFSNYEPDPSL